jgi:hypothetical protein
MWTACDKDNDGEKYRAGGATESRMEKRKTISPW